MRPRVAILSGARVHPERRIRHRNEPPIVVVVAREASHNDGDQRAERDDAPVEPDEQIQFTNGIHVLALPCLS